MKEVRVQFAPSPTGSLHIGGVRTALYNYLFAKKHNGKFIIRIEDTDQQRFVEHAENYIYESLNWLGIQANESVPLGGPYAPYKQSERMELYAKYAYELVEKGLAYYAFDSVEELDAIREKMKEEKSAFQYNGATRGQMKNSLNMLPNDVQAKIDSGEPFVIRLKVPKNQEVKLNDLVRGWVSVHSSTIDDKVLLKSDGMPTYHLANVVDDYLMKISHVIRGEEWLPSAPLHVLLYQSFGWENEMPQFAHLPLLLKPEGEGKLSKRDGELLGFPVFPLEWADESKGITIKGFREEGYLPEALINFLALMGWHPGTGEEKEIYSMDELVESFSLEHIGKAGARFDIQKARWFNHHYVKEKPDEWFLEDFQWHCRVHEIEISDSVALKWIHLVKDRITFAKEIWETVSPFLSEPMDYEPEVVAAKWNIEARNGILAFADVLDVSASVDAVSAKELLNKSVENIGIKPGKIIQILRLALTGKGSGLDLMTTIECLGNQEISRRIRLAVEKFPKLD